MAKITIQNTEIAVVKHARVSGERDIPYNPHFKRTIFGTIKISCVLASFWILLITTLLTSCNYSSTEVDADSNDAAAQTIFSIEKISKEEYIQADSTSEEYNIYPQRVDSITQCVVLNRIFQNAREHIADLDSVYRFEISVAVTDEELFCVDNLLYYPDLKLLGFKVPLDYHNNTIWWYDSTTGKPTMGTLFEPIAMNKNGIYVCQVLDDCDITLDLHFFEKHENYIYEKQAYKNNNYSGDNCLYMPEGQHYKSIFWHKNNLLYLRSYDLRLNEPVYLKISLN